MKKFVEKIKYLEEKYKRKYMKNEEEILNLRNKKYFTLSELQKIMEWKNPFYGTKKNSENNREEKVKKITSECFEKLKNREDDASTIKSVLNSLKKLEGVGISVASAILMAYNPEKFTPIDWRVWNALFLLCELDRPYPKNLKKDDYIEYLKACRKLARKLNIDLRTLDRALWTASKKYCDC